MEVLLRAGWISADAPARLVALSHTTAPARSLFTVLDV